MSEPLASARESAERANALIDKVETGGFPSDSKEAVAVEEARSLYQQALDVLEPSGDAASLADALQGLGHLLRCVDHNVTAAEPLLLRSAELRAKVGDVAGRLSALVELGESIPMHPVVDQAVMQAASAGLPADLDANDDPLHLVVARSHARQPDAAVALAEALLAEAHRHGSRARAARVLIEMGRVEVLRKQNKKARERFEEALALAEGDNEQTLRALLHLVDAWWSTGNAKKARELFARAEKIRGVPQSLRTLRKITKMALA